MNSMNNDNNKLITKEQLMAQKAWERVEERCKQSKFKDYKSFAMSFPALIHTCGLVQAAAFAEAKKQSEYISDLQKVFNEIDQAGDLKIRSREAELSEYSRISRHAMAAASWIKRYCQAKEVKEDEVK